MVISVGVTGSSGFIGSSVFDNLSKDTKFNTVKITRDNGAFVLHKKLDIIIHCAEVPDRKIVNDLGSPYKSEVLRNVDCLIGKCDRLIYLSSSVLYKTDTLNKKGEGSAITVTDNYTQIKSEIEKMVLTASGIVLRLSNVYGERMSPANVISDILSQVGSKIMILNNIHAVRDFIHVEDVAAYINEISFKNKFSGILNLGTGEDVKIQEIALIINNNSGFSDTEVFSKSRFKVNSIVLDVDKINEICTYRSVFNLKDFLLMKIGNH